MNTGNYIQELVFYLTTYPLFPAVSTALMTPMSSQESVQIGVPLSHFSRTISVEVAPVKVVPERASSYQI